MAAATRAAGVKPAGRAMPTNEALQSPLSETIKRPPIHRRVLFGHANQRDRGEHGGIADPLNVPYLSNDRRADRNSSTAAASASPSASPIGSDKAIIPRRASQMPLASMSKKN